MTPSAPPPADVRDARDRLEDRGDLAELVHFAATSEDVNNLCYALMVRGAVEQVWLPAARRLVGQVGGMARELAEVALLAHTHGQAATPTERREGPEGASDIGE